MERSFGGFVVTDFQSALEDNYKRGHFWNPSFPDLLNVKQSDLAKLKPDDGEAILSFRSRVEFQANDYYAAGLREYGKLPVNDGILGPAMEGMLSAARCDVPDFAPPEDAEFAFDDPDVQQICENLQTAEAQGSGNWAGCHSIGDFHCAIVEVHLDGLPSHLKDGVLTEVLGWVQKSYAQFGLKWVFRNNGKDMLTGEPVEGQANTDMRFVSSSSGWIGLAIVGRNQGCRDRIWLKLLSRYKGGASRASIINQWVTLIVHELFHNCSGMHQRGGFSNSSIVNNLPLIVPRTDPAARFLIDWFRGEPVPLDDEPPPKPDPKPDGLEKRVRELEKGLEENSMRDIARDAIVEYLLENVTSPA